MYFFEDVKSNPKRYVHFSLFGKKDIPANWSDFIKFRSILNLKLPNKTDVNN